MLLSADPKSCAGLNLIFVVASPNTLRLPPRGPRDLEAKGHMTEGEQANEKQLSFYIAYHTQNITLLITCTKKICITYRIQNFT
jgi:hypothetical protein